MRFIFEGQYELQKKDALKKSFYSQGQMKFIKQKKIFLFI